MSREYRLAILPNGANAVQIIFSGQDQPGMGQPFQRTLPQLNSVQIESLRRGEPKASDVEDLSQAVSDWLLGQDLRQKIETLIQKQNDPEQLRLVFAIDASLLPVFGDVPIELLRMDPMSHHLVVHTRVESIVHLLPKVAGSKVSAATLDWPMRILLVRSNPTDLGGRVPTAVPLRDAILKLGKQEFGEGMIQVDLLSSEAGAAGRPTWEEFRKVLKAQYHVLVYLGHGDVQQILEDVPPSSVLQFESQDDPAVHESVSAKQLALVLWADPIPVVLLAGCLTAAQPGSAPTSELSAWMRGNQGIAQALVNSESGVAFAVGMRSKIDAKDAVVFLNEFFRSLFKGNKGNVELALRAGRQELFLSKPHPPNWAAPIAFSSLEPEPVFSYLAQKINFPMTPALNINLDARRRFLWPLLADQPPGSRRASLTTAVDDNRAAIRAEVLAHGAMLLPELVDAQPGQAVVVSLTLEGVMKCKQLQAKLLLAPDLSFVKARATKLLTDGGYQVLNDPHDPGVFQIQLRPGVNQPPQLPNGVILEIDLLVADAHGICPVNLEVLATDCNQSFWPGNNAIIVTAV